jgi:hypothetical protein
MTIYTWIFVFSLRRHSAARRISRRGRVPPINIWFNFGAGNENIWSEIVRKIPVDCPLLAPNVRIPYFQHFYHSVLWKIKPIFGGFWPRNSGTPGWGPSFFSKLRKRVHLLILFFSLNIFISDRNRDYMRLHAPGAAENGTEGGWHQVQSLLEMLYNFLWLYIRLSRSLLVIHFRSLSRCINETIRYVPWFSVRRLNISSISRSPDCFHSLRQLQYSQLHFGLRGSLRMNHSRWPRFEARAFLNKLHKRSVYCWILLAQYTRTFRSDIP